MDYYGRQRALCGGNLGPPGKSGVGIFPPLTPSQMVSLGLRHLLSLRLPRKKDILEFGTN